MNEKEVIATDSTGIKSMRGKHGQTYANKFDSLDSMNKFPEKNLIKYDTGRNRKPE